MMTRGRQPTDQATLEAFMLRARRVQAHSIVQTDDLHAFADGSFSLRATDEGVELSQDAPSSEEAFESFAARVRPVTLCQEPVYYRNVLAAIERAGIDPNDKSFSEAFHAELKNLSNTWERAVNPAGDDSGYVVFQGRSGEKDDQLDVATMRQLAESWMYADVAHTDAKGDKRAGLEFSLKERYGGAVTYYSRLARTLIHTATLVYVMNRQGAVSLDEECLEADVGPVT